MKRKVVLTAAVVTVAGVAAAWGLSAVVESPAQAAARARPPEPSVLTVPVERRELVETVILRGRVTPTSVVEVRAPGQTVTKAPVRAGTEVRSGDVVVELNGRPVIVLDGAVPSYRDLSLGTSGADVAQLQLALARLGFPSPDTSGQYGPGTARSAAQAYARAGYPPPSAGTGPGSDLEAKQAAKRQAERDLGTPRLTADIEIARAERAAARAQDTAARRGAEQSRDPGEVADAEELARVAEENVRLTRSVQAGNVAAAEEALGAAAEALAAVLGSVPPPGSHLPQQEVVYVPDGRAAVLDAPLGPGAAPTDGPTVRLTSGRLAVEASASPGGPTLTPGQSAEMLSEASGERSALEVEAVLPAEQGGLLVRLQPVEPLDPAANGRDVRVTVTTQRSGGEVLVVPQTALFTEADGSVVVRRFAGGAPAVPVPVDLGMRANGAAEIRPRGPLGESDLVIVGWR